MTSFIENPAVWEETKQELAETFGKEIPELFEKVWKACEKKLEANQKYYKAGESNYAVEILEEEFCIQWREFVEKNQEQEHLDVIYTFTLASCFNSNFGDDIVDSLGVFGKTLLAVNSQLTEELARFRGELS